MELTVVTPSTGLPITLEDAKDQLGITSNVQDTFLTRKVKLATEYCERRIAGHRTLMTTVYDGTLDELAGRIEMPVPPLQSVASVKYYDADGVQQTLSSTAYISFAPTDDPGYIEPAPNESWPTSQVRGDAVTIRFTAGYSTASAVPETMKEAVRQMTAHFYEFRGPELSGTITSQLANGIDRLLGCNDWGAYD